jgi:hypothetical protein
MHGGLEHIAATMIWAASGCKDFESRAEQIERVKKKKKRENKTI